MDAMRELSKTHSGSGYVYEKLDRIESIYLDDYLLWKHSKSGYRPSAKYFDFLSLTDNDKRIMAKWRDLENRHLRPKYNEITDPLRRNAIIDLMNLAIIESRDKPDLDEFVHGYLKARDSINAYFYSTKKLSNQHVLREYGTNPKHLSEKQRINVLLLSMKERMLAEDLGYSYFEPLVYSKKERLSQLSENWSETADRIKEIHYENKNAFKVKREQEEAVYDFYYDRIHRANSNASLVLIQNEFENDPRVSSEMDQDFKKYIRKIRSEKGFYPNPPDNLL
ncbi:MAG: hypothetical protein ACTSPB_01450 [Candidatus Thorarchaeota archaeon]